MIIIGAVIVVVVTVIMVLQIIKDKHTHREPPITQDRECMQYKIENTSSIGEVKYLFKNSKNIQENRILKADDFHIICAVEGTIHILEGQVEITEL